MTIRRLPADFRVTERLSAESLVGLRPKPGPGRFHAVFLVDKQSLSTPEAEAALARALNLAPSMVAHAGLKDKHAQTRQHLSANLSARPLLDASPIVGERWRAELVGWSTRHLDGRDVGSNLFELVVRALDDEQAEAMERRARRLLAPKASASEAASAASPLQPDAELRVVNYFGAQRFGSARHAQGFAGPLLMRGQFEAALRLLIATPARKDTGTRRDTTRAADDLWGQWAELADALPPGSERRAVERLAKRASSEADFRDAFALLPRFTQQMALDAFHALLWNDAARRLVIANVPPERLLRADDDFGELLFPDAEASSPDGSGAWLANLEAPMLGPEDDASPSAAPQATSDSAASDAVTPDPRWLASWNGALGTHALARSELRTPGLRRPALRDTPRRLVVGARAFALSSSEPDELATPRSPKRWKRSVSFELPAGAYATNVLRALGQ
jgi:tRNA pseudouridine13 synthase